MVALGIRGEEPKKRKSLKSRIEHVQKPAFRPYVGLSLWSGDWELDKAYTSTFARWGIILFSDTVLASNHRSTETCPAEAGRARTIHSSLSILISPSAPLADSVSLAPR